MKLVYTHWWGDESSSGVEHICFEYHSKEKFVYDVLEKFKDKKWNNIVSNFSGTYNEKVPLFNHPDSITVDQYEVEGIEHCVFTLEEWWKRNQIDYELVENQSLNKPVEFFQK